MANRKFLSQFLYSFHAMLVELDSNFVVDRTNANGMGIRSLKGPGILNVFMNAAPVAVTTTSVFASGVNQVTVASLANLYVGQPVTDSTTGGNITAGTKIVAINAAQNLLTLNKVTAGASAVSPGDTLSFQFASGGTGNGGFVNPNPAAGLIIVQFQDNYFRYYFGTAGFVSPTTGTNIVVTAAGAHLVAGKAYVITVLGTTTAADWVTMGLPIGMTAAVGSTFIAIATGAGTGTGQVQLTQATGSGVNHIEPLGDPNTTLGCQLSSQNGGGQIILGVYGDAPVNQNGTTHTNTTVDGLTTTANLRPGMSVGGTGIPSGTIISSITSSTAIVISQAATASATVAINFGSAPILMAPADNTVLGLSFFLSNSSVQVQGE